MNFELFRKAAAETLNEISIVEVVLTAAGLVVLAAWLFKTSFGAKALVNPPVRRIDMPASFVLIPFLLWILSSLILDMAKRAVFTDVTGPSATLRAGWQNAFADNLIMCLSAVPPVATILFIAYLHYARRLKGLGLNLKTIGRDLPAACLNLVVVLPAVGATANFTLLAAQFFAGPQYEWPKHEELKLLMEYPQQTLRILIVAATIVIGPIMEEFLFRGLVQTTIRSYLARPWLAIIFASFVFLIFHPVILHWPALFVLSLCLGYSYEKSGSLLRPIFIHSIFNALNVFTAIYQ